MKKVLRNQPETSLPPFGWQNTAKGRASQSTECPSIAEDIINLKFSTLQKGTTFYRRPSSSRLLKQLYPACGALTS